MGPTTVGGGGGDGEGGGVAEMFAKSGQQGGGASDWCCRFLSERVDASLQGSGNGTSSAPSSRTPTKTMTMTRNIIVSTHLLASSLATVTHPHPHSHPHPHPPGPPDATSPPSHSALSLSKTLVGLLDTLLNARPGGSRNRPGIGGGLTSVWPGAIMAVWREGIKRTKGVCRWGNGHEGWQRVISQREVEREGGGGKARRRERGREGG